MGAYNWKIYKPNFIKHGDVSGTILFLIAWLLICLMFAFFGSGNNTNSKYSSGYYDDAGYGDPAIPYN